MAVMVQSQKFYSPKPQISFVRLETANNAFIFVSGAPLIRAIECRARPSNLALLPTRVLAHDRPLARFRREL